MNYRNVSKREQQNNQQILRAMFLNRRAAALYRALASIKPDSVRFSWNLSF
jgi:hypothetical protein